MPGTAPIDESAQSTFQPNQRQREYFESLKFLSPGDVVDILVRWLTRGNKDQTELAKECFVIAGPTVVPILVREAVRPRRSDAQRIRILDVIEKIGVLLGINEFHSIHRLLLRSTVSVQQRIMRLLLALRNGSTSDADNRPVPTLQAIPV